MSEKEMIKNETISTLWWPVCQLAVCSVHYKYYCCSLSTYFYPHTHARARTPTEWVRAQRISCCKLRVQKSIKNLQKFFFCPFSAGGNKVKQRNHQLSAHNKTKKLFSTKFWSESWWKKKKNRPHRRQRQRDSSSTKISWCWAKSHICWLSSFSTCHIELHTYCIELKVACRFNFFFFTFLSCLSVRALSDSRHNCVQTTWHYKIKCKLNNFSLDMRSFVRYFFSLSVISQFKQTL